ncbi:MAG: hypothetical protein ACRDNK_22185 [Solirubrobacteraceae bacterium]
MERQRLEPTGDLDVRETVRASAGIQVAAALGRELTLAVVTG